MGPETWADYHTGFNPQFGPVYLGEKMQMGKLWPKVYGQRSSSLVLSPHTLVSIIWLSSWFVYNLSGHPYSHVSCPVRLCYIDVSIFPDLSNYFGEYNIIITHRNDVQNSQNKTQVVIKKNYPLIILQSVHKWTKTVGNTTQKVRH